jgi:hypothetical protein
MTCIDPHELEKVIEAIIINRARIQWKSGKADPHLAKRIRLGHLPENSTLAEYEAVITNITSNQKAKIYVYIYNRLIYPTLTAIVEDRLWLVMMGIDGVLETSFPPDKPEIYLNNNSFVYLGVVEELLV